MGRGCTIPAKVKDLRGRRFDRLLVSPAARPALWDGHAYWPVNCDCGALVIVRGSKLLNHSTVSCGCERADPEVRSRARGVSEPTHPPVQPAAISSPVEDPDGEAIRVAES